MQAAIFMQAVSIPEKVMDRLHIDFADILGDQHWAGEGKTARDVAWGVFWVPCDPTVDSSQAQLDLIEVRFNEQSEGRVTWWPLSLVKTAEELALPSHRRSVP